ncbi:MAG: phosphoribosyl transferase [Paramuribaculum sp.]|nr:phosphoribosyl transferase [Paramuribaculum sp.]
MEYRSISDMNQLILKNLSKIPPNIDLVVGVPRSGMLPANLISLYLNIPFTDIDSFTEGRIYSSGERGKELSELNIKRILIVDDSIASGNAQNKAKAKLKDIANKYDLFWGVVFATTKTKDMVDFYCEIIDSQRVFQWNIFHHGILANSCFDLDGVLCEDPPIDDDGDLYINYLKNATPLFIPTVPIGTIVTCRLEKYRDITVEWLKKHNVKYDKLIMLPFKTKEERTKWGKHGTYKGEFIKKSNNVLFIESSLSQAQEINRISDIPVFCTETFTLIDKSISKKIALTIKQKIKTLIGDKLLLKFRSFHKKILFL